MNWIKSLLFILNLIFTQQLFAGTISVTGMNINNATVNFVVINPAYADTMLITIDADSALEIKIKLDDIRKIGIDPLQFANLLVTSNLKMMLELDGTHWNILAITFSSKNNSWL